MKISSNRNSYAWLVGMQTAETTLDRLWAVSYKAEPSSPYALAIDLGIYPNDLKLDVHTKTCMQTLMSFIHDHRNVEATKLFRRRMYEQNVVWSYDKRLFCDKKE